MHGLRAAGARGRALARWICATGWPAGGALGISTYLDFLLVLAPTTAHRFY